MCGPNSLTIQAGNVPEHMYITLPHYVVPIRHVHAARQSPLLHSYIFIQLADDTRDTHNTNTQKHNTTQKHHKNMAKTQQKHNKNTTKHKSTH